MADYLVKSEKVNYGSASWAVDLHVVVETVVQSIDTNTTTIRLGMYVYAPYDIAWNDYYGSYLGAGSYNGGSEQKKTFTQGADGYGTMWLAPTTTVTIQHASDGSAVNVPIIWKWGVNSPWGQYVQPSGTKYITLPTIPRATTPTMSNPTMGSTVTINLPRASDSFTHTLTYAFGSASGTIATGAGASASWAVPLSLASQVPNATSGVGTLTCQTYNGSTLIGTKSINFTAYVPASVVPTISAVSISEATSGLAAKFAAYVQNKSTLAVGITAAGSYSSTITKYETTILGVKYTEASFTSQVLTTSGSVSVAVTVTDSRGRTASSTQTITVLAYFVPRINSMTAWRINTSGTADDDGTRVAVQMNFAIADVVSRNDRTFSLQYKKSGDEYFTDLSGGTASWTYNGTQYFTSSPELSVDYAYVIRLTITDYFQTVTKDYEVPTAFTLFDCRSTGKGFSFGKVSEKDALEVAMNMEITGQAKIYTPASDVADSGYLRLYQKDGTLRAFVTTADNGGGLKIHYYQGGNWSAYTQFNPDGSIGGTTRAKILDMVYPVGSYYWSSISTNPETLFGGTWEQVKDKFVLAAGDSYSAGATGGEATHTLTVSEIPSHRHNMGVHMQWENGGSNSVQGSSGSYDWDATMPLNKFPEYTGGDGAHNNMPPYEVAYCWKRTA